MSAYAVVRLLKAARANDPIEIPKSFRTAIIAVLGVISWPLFVRCRNI